MKKRKNLFILVVLSVIAIFIFTGCGSSGSGSDDDSEPGICGICEGDQNESNCSEGWCSKFKSGPNRCVPDDVGLNDDYTCVVNN